MTTDLIQFPSKVNNWTAICQTIIVGYGWDHVNDKVCEVTFSDIADANDTNCTAMVKNAYIRMASTRSIGRALRKYTNIDMVCSAELSDVVEEDDSTPQLITTEMLEGVKSMLGEKGISREEFSQILMKEFQTNNYMALTVQQGGVLLSVLARHQKVEQAPNPTPNQS